MTPWTLLTATAGLIAFHIGLFTLVGRERKSPYVINSLFPVFIICLLVGILCIAAAVLDPTYEPLILRAAGIVLALAMLLSILAVSRTAVRFIWLVDSVNPKRFGPIRSIRRLFKRKGPTYEHNAVALSDALREKISTVAGELGGEKAIFRGDVPPESMAVSVEHQGQSNEMLSKLALLFIEENLSVQYLSASRHPIEFLLVLKNAVEAGGRSWTKVSKQIVVIDAYSPHFAFTDSWYPLKTGEVVELGVTYVRSGMTYAGIHSAAGRAFDKIRKQMGNERHRDPTLVIYEDTGALSDLESSEQYRIFVRHVMPSERMWGGMFTVFLEACPRTDDWNLLQSQAALAVDFDRG